jgi:hypothetical protein
VVDSLGSLSLQPVSTGLAEIEVARANPPRAMLFFRSFMEIFSFSYLGAGRFD